MTGNGRCTDVDECLTDICPDVNDFCQNTMGSFQCICNAGYIFDDTSCADIDECLENVYNCTDNSYCQNSGGSYDCLCEDGFRKTDEELCLDIDECAEEVYMCANTEKCAENLYTPLCPESSYCNNVEA